MANKKNKKQPDKKKLVSMRELSRIVGVNLKAVQDAVKYERIKPERIEKHGKRTLYRFDPEKCKRDWKNNTSLIRRATRKEKGKGSQPAHKKGARKDDPGISQASDKTGKKYHEARANKESLQAEIAQLELDAKQGELIKRETVSGTFFNIAKEVSKNMMNIPDRVSPIVAAETDIPTINNLLTDEIKNALTALSNKKYDK